ncbi:RsmG family class I SAM-dependent methyltransferase [Sphingorhabdus sp. Alg239-R122]|uniref:16S rRNA (guanine(527)-N(7))-methyltransferase RsmG n=1 Tax=Sphingorhabdus sp. Alg239-R122 TaxID=2305989 RepID=UPI0013DC0BD3|nr:RsmG family class I SAM-dependent methyltransferase [Sphingorhabdus sp. Alg239-R122]
MIPLSIITSENEAREWLRSHLDVSSETLDKLSEFCVVLEKEAKSQNLIAPSTLPHIWIRHIVDSAQLLGLAKSYGHSEAGGAWLDLGTGAGFPGLVIAMLSSWEVVMVESRARRIDYLQRMVERFDLGRAARVEGTRLENLDSFDTAVISARAFAPLDRLLLLTERFSTEKTLWLLPKGRNASKELEALSDKWQHLFHVKHSITDEDAKILSGYLVK